MGLMRVIITGGAGMIGRALTASLVRDGHEVVVLTRSPEAGRPRSNAGAGAGQVRYVGWDSRTARGWGNLVDGAAIVNLAAESLEAGRWTSERRARILGSRVNAGRAVTEAVRGASVKPIVVIQPSGSNYYAPAGGREIDENGRPDDGFLGQVARQWEASTEEVEGLGVRRAITRSGVVLSMEGGALPRIVQPFRFFVGGPVGGGRQWLPWIHIHDEAGVIRHLIDREDLSGPFNACAPHCITNGELARTIGAVLHRPALVPVPGFVLKVLFGEMASLVLEGERLVSNRLLNSGYRFRFPNLRAALEDLL
jgi:uncharacterized protein (TIGR01777 family)